MKYSLSPNELNNWKARITERLVLCYIEEYSIPSLREEESWDEVFFDNLDNFDCPLSAIEKGLLRGFETPIFKAKLPYQQSFYRSQVKLARSYINRILLKKAVFPHQNLFDKWMLLLQLLEVRTDGFLFKLKRTGNVKPKEEIISELGEYVCPEGMIELPKAVPIVEGEIEIIEVKSGKAFIPPYQQDNYRKVVKNGFLFRFFRVNIISFERNQFDVEEKLIRRSAELKSFRVKSQKREGE